MQLFKLAEFTAVHEQGGSYYQDDDMVSVAGWRKNSASSELPNDTCEHYVIWQYDQAYEIVNIEEFTADSYSAYVKSVTDYKRRNLNKTPLPISGCA